MTSATGDACLSPSAPRHRDRGGVAKDPGARVTAFASPKGLKSGTILKIKFRNVVGELVATLNREFTGARFCTKGRRVVFTAGHPRVPCAVERLKRVGVHFLSG